MALDITTIGIEYDTSGLEKGTRAQDKTTQSANKLGESVDRTEKSFSSLNKMLGYAAGALAAVGGVMLAKQFVQTADAITLMDARLKLATGSLEDFHQAQKDIYAIAQANNVGLQETSQLYTKLSDPVRRLGGTSKEVGAIVDSFATSLRVGGASAQEASAATLQFAQAMASGRLQGDEFRSIAEASPRFMKALADGMGVPIEKLKEFGSEGKLTADVVGNALVKSLDQLKKEAQSIPDTVSGSITRFKNDVLLAVGEISNAQGFTTGFAGLIESARGLIPVIKDEVLGAFVAVNGWIDRNREGLINVWDNVKGIVGGVWEVVKGAASAFGFITEWATQSGLVKTTLETIRFLIAGVQDGVTIIGAGFALMGSKIFQFILEPLQKVLEKSAKIAGLFNDELAEKIRGIGTDIGDFAKSGENYANSVAKAFGEGDSAVGRLNVELGKSASATKEIGKESKKATDAAIGGYGLLKSSIKDTDEKNKKATKEGQEVFKELNRFKVVALKQEHGLIEDINKESKKEREDTKKWMQDQRDNYNYVNKSLDDHAQKMAEANEFAQMEIDLLGVSAVERNTLIEQKKIQIALEKELSILKDMNLTAEKRQELIDKATTQANIDKSTAQLRAQQGEWTKFYSEIYNGLSDSLYRGFESGKGFGKSFLDSLKNLFKTNVLKIMVQGVMTGIGGTVSNMAQAYSQGGGGASSLMSMGKTLWDGFSAAGTIGGGISQMGGMLGSSTLSAFGGGMAGYGSAGVGFGAIGAQGAASSTFLSGAGTSFGGISTGLSAPAGGATAAAGAGSSMAAALPIVGWVLAGMAANNSLFDKGWGGKSSNETKQYGIASGMIGGAFENTIQKMFGLSDKSASMFSGSAVVNRLFGHKNKELQQSELSGSFGAGGYSASTRDVFKQQGGVFRSDKWSETVNKADSSAMTEAFTSIKDAAKGYASVLGLSTSAIDTFTKDFKVNLSITGDAAKDAEANQKVLTGILTGIGDDLSNLLAPSLKTFAKEGETASATLQRMAVSLTNVNQIMTAAGLANFAKSLEGANASQRLLDLTGGIEKLASGTQYFVENFLSDAEKIKPSMDLVSETMARLGMSNVKTIEDFKLAIKGGEDASGKLVNVLKYNCNVPSTNSKFEAVASEADTLDGLNPHYAGIDEYHSHKTSDVLEVMETGMGSRSQPLLLITTTAGFNRESPCYMFPGQSMML